LTVRFYLGTHKPGWLGTTDVPLFVSRRSLIGRRTMPRARGPWALDSGGFTEIAANGHWFGTPARQYVAEVRRIVDQVGRPDFIAPQDWMCEPEALAKTGLSLRMHQQLTIWSYQELRDLAPDLPWCPVLQGWGVTDYWRHHDWYDAVGIDLVGLPVVGVGSVCRRQGAASAGSIFYTLAERGLRNLHGFGLKTKALAIAAELVGVYGYCYLASADSLAWSRQARFRPPLPGCSHATCANCIRFALAWRRKVLASAEPAPFTLAPPVQRDLFTPATED
jgi:hypothetical protein